MTWKNNPIMEWWDVRGTPQWVKISDHSRDALAVTVERIESKQRMVDGTMRKYVVAKKRTWSTTWSNLPSKNVPMLANGQAGEWMEQFHNDTDNAFWMRLRDGSDIANTDTTAPGGTSPAIEEVRVMISDFSKDIVKRGVSTDLWNLNLTLEEV